LVEITAVAFGAKKLLFVVISSVAIIVDCPVIPDVTTNLPTTVASVPGEDS